jgi:signal transduction histidine kinase
MNFRKSIRWRIQSWHGMLLLAVISGFGVMTYRLQSSNAWRRADGELEVRLGALTGELGRGGAGRPPHPADDSDEMQEGPRPGFQAPELIGIFDPKDKSPYYFQIWSRDGPLIGKSGGAPDGVPNPALTSEIRMTKGFRDREGFREAYVFTPPGECLLVGRSMAPVLKENRDFTWRLVGIGSAVMVFGLAVGWWLSGRALRPIAQISSTAARIADGNLAERIGTRETESELGQLSTVLDHTFQRLDHAFAEQARFTSDAAHELRTPVSVILGQAQLALARERSVEEHRTTIETCQRAARRMHSLIDSLLELSLLDGDREKLQLQPCDLAEICREHLAMIRPLADEKGVVLKTEFTSAPCKADPERISQILDNFIVNALKFSPSGGKIHILTGMEKEEAVLKVSDDGPGISSEHLPHLFERFYRADASRNRATGGAGLGLAICKSIADAHHGSIRAESEMGKGSVFTLRVPAVQPFIVAE